MSKDINESTIMKTLDWAYEKALSPGVPGMESAYDLARDYSKEDLPIDEQVSSLIRWQIAKCGTSGFITGLGGFLTMPVAIPANIASVLYIQLRMIAAIAIMSGYDVKADQVKTFVYACLCGSAVVDILKQAGVKIGQKLAINVIKKIPGAVIFKINQLVGFRLLTKFGQTGIVNLGKAIPFLGGLIGGTFDAVTTNQIGEAARQLFIQAREDPNCTASKSSIKTNRSNPDTSENPS
jgi:hypothetical protein